MAPVAIAVALVAITLAVYAPARQFGFLTFDDPDYVTANAHVSGGVSSANVIWAFTAFHAGTWMPVTWLSYMADATLHGVDAGWFHVTNVALHVTNTLVLFGLLLRLTGAPGRSAFVATLFGVHPLHVESVAWIAERKDVLSTLCWWLALWAYVAYVRRPNWARYALVAGCFAIGLMAKPMLVTLPLTLLLLDVWPLGRLSESRGWGALIREKLPLVALSAVSTAITFAAQRQVGAVADLDVLPLGTRVANGLISYVEYLVETIWPAHLTILYPFPAQVSTVAALASLVLLVGATCLALRARRRHPYIAVGWCWYLFTLLPVIGLAQVGSHAMADRFTYVPLVGIFIMIAWGVPDLAARWRQWGLASVATAVIVVAAAIARVQTGYWQDSLTCWRHALEVTTDNFIAEDAVGGVLTEQGRVTEAIGHFNRALEIHPDFPGARHNLAVALTKMGRAQVSEGHITEGITQYREALRDNPDLGDAHDQLGRALSAQGQIGEALIEFREAVRLDPESAEADEDLGLVLFAGGQVEAAIAEYREALRLAPDSADAHESLAVAYVAERRIAEAIAEFQEVLRLDPKNSEAQRALAELRR